MTVRLYFDEDSSRQALARQLRARGIEVVTAPEAGTLGNTDEDQLRWAASHGFSLYSFNRSDFYALHTQWLRANRSHSGIILSRQDLPIGAQMPRLLRLAASRSAEEMRNIVEFLGSWS